LTTILTSISTFIGGTEMFKKLGQNSVQSREGFVLSVISRNQLKYEEGDKIMMIDREAGVDRNNQWYTAIYTSNITRWQPPYDNESITEEKKQQIVQRVCAVLDFLEIKYVLE